MYSRYDLLGQSMVTDKESGQAYPDPLSKLFNTLQLTALPLSTTLSSGDLAKFWFWYYQKYNGATDGDDILLIMNGIPYLGSVTPGDTIYLPGSSDIRTPTFAQVS